MQNKCKIQTFIKVKKEKLFIRHKTSNMRYQSREFHKFFWAINCCSYKTRGFHKISEFSHFAKIFSQNFCILHFRKNFFCKILLCFLLHFISRNFAKKFAKCEYFRICLRNILFTGNPSWNWPLLVYRHSFCPTPLPSSLTVVSSYYNSYWMSMLLFLLTSCSNRAGRVLD